MAETATFRAALEHCGGITQELAHQTIVQQGYTLMTEFDQIPNHEIRNFVKEVNKHPAVNDEVPHVPYASIKKLKAMKEWTKEHVHFGLAITHISFTVQELTCILTRMDLSTSCL